MKYQVGVQFKGSQKVYAYLTDISDLKAGDQVVVDTRYGRKTVTVVGSPTDIPDDIKATAMIISKVENEEN